MAPIPVAVLSLGLAALCAVNAVPAPNAGAILLLLLLPWPFERQKGYRELESLTPPTPPH